MASLEFENRLWKAQEGRCGICGGLLHRALRLRDHEGWNLDHVWPRSRYSSLGNRGNLLLTHRLCNARKSNREPTGCELVLLELVNARTGYDRSRKWRKRLAELRATA